MRWTVPNILTVLRLASAPVVGLAFLFLARPWADWLAVVLFVLAAVTDYVDGRLARLWRQESAFGAMLDPIADKAIVVISLAALLGLIGLNPWIFIPAVVILFREVFVSGLREYLGDRSHHVKVTQLAKWKTTVQMVAIAVLFAQGIFVHYFGMHSFGMDPAMVDDILSGREPDLMGLRWKYQGALWSYYGGTALLWLAALLTAATGWDYWRKSVPILKEADSR